MSLNIYTLGKRIQIARKRAGLSQNEVSERIGKTSSFLSYVENGSKGMKLETFVELVNVLDVTANELLIDCLNNTDAIIESEFSNIVKDCNPYEKRVLVDILVAVRDILKANRSIIYTDHYK